MINVALVLLIPVQALTQVNLSFSPAPSAPAIFSEGLISTPLSERDFALSPDGTELFYTVQLNITRFQTIIYLKKDKSGKWSKPEVAPFCGHYTDLEPAFSADGKKLFFTSNRPVEGDKPKDFDIWVSEKVNGNWTEPKNLGEVVNTPADEFYPSLAQNGNLYFTATYKNGIGREDIYVAKWENDHYAQPVVLDANVNSATYEFNAYVSPDEQFILFTSYGRKDDMGRGDLYISIKDSNGNWQPAKNLVALNSNQIDYCPFVSFDKKILFFTSERHNLPSVYEGKAVAYKQLGDAVNSILNGNGNIYWVNFEEVLRQTK